MDNADQNVPKNIVLSPAAASMNLSCYGFLRYGRDFRSAAQSFDNGGTFSIVPYFLHSQAIELGLKAFLLLKGIQRKKLKSAYGHDLDKLLKFARDDGLAQFFVFPSNEAAAIHVANEFYNSGPAGKRFQYFDIMMAVRGFKGLPDLTVLASASGRLLANDALYDACLRA